MLPPADAKQNRKNTRAHICITLFYLAGLIFGALFLAIVTIMEFKKSPKLDQIEDLLDTVGLNLNGLQLVSEKGQPDGYVPLVNGTVPEEFLDIPDTVFFNKGCWDALNNVPFLQSSVGTNGDMYTVCEEGNFPLNGVTEWYYRDRVLFIGSLDSWVRLDGARQNITEPVGSGEGMVADGLGPEFTLKIILEGSGILISDNGDTLQIQFDNTSLPGQVMLSSVGGGEEFPADTVGPDLTVKTLVEAGGLTITTTATGLAFNLPALVVEAEASTPVVVVLPWDPPFTNIDQQFYYFIGNNAWLQTFELGPRSIPGSQTNVTGHISYRSLATNVIRTGLSPDPILADFIWQRMGFLSFGNAVGGCASALFYPPDVDVACNGLIGGFAQINPEAEFPIEESSYGPVWIETGPAAPDHFFSFTTHLNGDAPIPPP